MTSTITDSSGGPELTRRQLLITGTAVGVLSATALGASGRALGAPKRGGRFRIGHAGASTNNSLDPVLIDDEYMKGVCFALRNNLTEIDSDGMLASELAESWEATPDARQWRVTLRQSVEFHDGKTLDANDVVASLNHHRGPDSISPAKPIVNQIEDIQADGPTVVVITLQEGNADLPYLLSADHLNILPATEQGVDWQSGNGTGGYILESFEPGTNATFKRNPNYWKADRANFDEVEMLGINDPVARTSALITGEVDAINRCDLKTVDKLAQEPDVAVEEVTGYEHFTAPMLTDTAPFGDNNIRLAFKYAIDREALLKAVLFGHGIVTGQDQPLMPKHKYFDPSIPPHQYDPDKAKYHLKQAGLSNLAMNLSAADAAFVGAVDAAVLIKEQARPAGLDITVVREPNDAYWSDVWQRKKWCMSRWGGRPTADWIFTIGYSEGAPWNDTHWSNERFNNLLVTARAEFDDGKRQEMYSEMQRILHEDGGMPNLMFGNWVYARSEKVAHGPSLSPVWDMDGQKAAERWWFA